ncbi:PAS domain-containing protein [Methylobacterium phyllostachyos]|uniref:PAS domain-containing protein n=1 Tax=Methylobacterium phyllostachyos TaxID=582672 RepID=UPI000A45CBE1|nr:PAS domain-containing protein [Methylobacterium phyllostachyos]
MIFVTDASGQTIHTSSDWPVLTGQTIKDSLGRGWLKCVHPEDRAIVERTLEEALSKVSEFSIRYRLAKPSGDYRWVGVGGVPSIGPPDYTFIGYLGSLTEIADCSTAEIHAYGNVERFIPPPTHPATIATDHLDQIADYLILAHALIEADGAKSALPGLRLALFEVGCALADRVGRPAKPN